MAGLKDFFDNLIGEEGVKTDVSLDLAPTVYVYLIMAIAVGMTIGGIGMYYAKKTLS